MGMIEKSKNLKIVPDLVEAIKTKGWYGKKAYFNAFIRENESKSNIQTIMINISRVLPVESW